MMTPSRGSYFLSHVAMAFHFYILTRKEFIIEGLLEPVLFITLFLSKASLTVHTNKLHAAVIMRDIEAGKACMLAVGELPELGGEVQEVGQIGCQGPHQVLANDSQALEDTLQQFWLCLRTYMP